MVFGLALAGALAAAAAPDTVLNPARADSLIHAQNGQCTFVIVDVRTPEEYASGHLKNAWSADIRSPGFREKVGQVPRDAHVLLYCRSGHRSAQAMAVLREMGYKDLRHLEGGIIAWNAAGLPTVK